MVGSAVLIRRRNSIQTTPCLLHQRRIFRIRLSLREITALVVCVLLTALDVYTLGLEIYPCLDPSGYVVYHSESRGLMFLSSPVGNLYGTLDPRRAAGTSISLIRTASPLWVQWSGLSGNVPAQMNHGR